MREVLMRDPIALASAETCQVVDSSVRRDNKGFGFAGRFVVVWALCPLSGFVQPLPSCNMLRIFMSGSSSAVPFENLFHLLFRKVLQVGKKL